MAETSLDDVLVSVIVPVYQAASDLDECVGSLVAQVHRNVEIILVDDGSTDGGGPMCDVWARRDPRVTVIHAANGGLSVARNRGLDAATGAFVSFVDADDVVSPQYVTTLLGAALSTGADVVLADLVAFADGAAPPAYRDGGQPHVETPHEALARIVRTGIGFASCGKLMSAEVFSHLRFRPGSDFEDLEILPRLLARCTVVAVSDSANYGYRQHEGSLMDGHRKVLRPSLLVVLQSNIELARATQIDPGARDDLVVGYVLHAMRTLEATRPSSTQRAPDYDAAYRRFVASHLRVLVTSSQLSPLYKVAVVLSVISPSLYLLALTVARGLKASVAPSLRRRSGPVPR